MIDLVGDEDTTWSGLPNKFEAGTPNVEGAVGLAAAVGYLESLGMDAVAAHERALAAYAEERLTTIEGLRIHGPRLPGRNGVVSFTVAGIHPHDLATVLDAEGVCVRAGHHCAQPLMRRLGVGATARASFWVYNEEADVDALVAGLAKARALFGPVEV